MLPQLVRMLSSDSALLQQEALWSIQNVSAAAASASQEATDGGADAVRELDESHEYEKAIKRERVLEPLAALLHRDDHPKLQEQAALALANIASRESTKQLILSLNVRLLMPRSLSAPSPNPSPHQPIHSHRAATPPAPSPFTHEHEHHLATRVCRYSISCAAFATQRADRSRRRRAAHSMSSALCSPPLHVALSAARPGPPAEASNTTGAAVRLPRVAVSLPRVGRTTDVRTEQAIRLPPARQSACRGWGGRLTFVLSPK